MSEHVDFVNAQIAFHESMADKLKANPRRQSRHMETAGQFKGLLSYIVSLEAGKQMLSAGSGKKPIPLALTFDEIEGLPPELIQELSVSDGDRMDFAILRIIENGGGISSLDRILVGIYKETGEVMKRTTLTSKVYRMSQKGLLFSVPNKKGVYSTQELTDAQAEELI